MGSPGGSDPAPGGMLMNPGGGTLMVGGGPLPIAADPVTSQSVKLGNKILSTGMVENYTRGGHTDLGKKFQLFFAPIRRAPE